MMYADLNQEQAAGLKDRDVTAILPIGATEVHGNHLPLGTDTYLVEALVKKVEEKLGEEHCLILPTVPYGPVWSLQKAPGSIHVPDEILSRFLARIGEGVWQAGIKKLAIINTHVGNAGTMKAAARILYDSCPIKVYLFTYPGADETIRKVCTAPLPHQGYFHACEIETSYMLYLCPEKVDMGKAVCQYPEFPPEFDYTPTRWTELMDVAVLGDATQASAEKGREIIDKVVENICGMLKEGTGEDNLPLPGMSEGDKGCR